MSNSIYEAEAMVISALIKHPHLYDGCGITPEMLSDDTRADIFRAIGELSGGEAFDAITLSDALEQRTGDNWLPIIGAIAQNFSSPGLFDGYVSILKREYLKRSAAEIANKLLMNLDSSSAVDDAVSALMGLDVSGRNYEFSAKDMSRAAVAELDRVHELRGAVVGVPTGIPDLDAQLGGFHPGDLTIIGARSAMGKTALMLNFAASANDAGIISTEQDHQQVGQRRIGIAGNVSLARMRSGQLSDDDFTKITNGSVISSNQNVWLNEKRVMTAAEIARQARKWVKRYGVKILFVDYIQRLHAADKSQSKAYQVGDIVKDLKSLAGELHIPIVALAQVNRAVESRPDKRAYMADLKDSGEIEQEADQVLTIYRDEYYNPKTEEKGIAELIICKNRHGPTGLIKTVWEPNTLRFLPLDSRFNV